jgi:hypothetical protein
VLYHLAYVLRLQSRSDEVLAELSKIESAYRNEQDFFVEQAAIEVDICHYDTTMKLYKQLEDSELIARVTHMKHRSYYVNWMPSWDLTVTRECRSKRL